MSDKYNVLSAASDKVELFADKVEMIIYTSHGKPSYTRKYHVTLRLPGFRGHSPDKVMDFCYEFSSIAGVDILSQTVDEKSQQRAIENGKYEMWAIFNGRKKHE